MKWAMTRKGLGVASVQTSSNQPRLLLGRSPKESFLEEVLAKLTFERGLDKAEEGAMTE